MFKIYTARFIHGEIISLINWQVEVKASYFSQFSATYAVHRCYIWGIKTDERICPTTGGKLLRQQSQFKLLFLRGRIFDRRYDLA